MRASNIGYHTRLLSNNSTKVVGGSFGGAIDADTVERLTRSHFTVIVKPSGRAVFVDREGREVSLYLSVDPESTSIGALALQNYHIEKQRTDREASEQRAKEEREIEELMHGLPHSEIMKRLKS